MIEDRNQNIALGKRNRTLKILENIAFVIFMIVVLSMIFLATQSKITGGEPRILGHRIYIVDSGSMTPTLPVDSMIIVKETPPSEIKKGDIITYYGHDKTSRVTHRAVEVVDNGKSFITRGDANEINDPLPLEGKKLIGKVIYKIPRIGSIFRFLNTSIGMALLVSISLAWIVIPMLIPKASKNK